MASDERASRLSSRRSTSPGANHAVTASRLSSGQVADFDSGSFTFITEDDLVQQDDRPQKGDHQGTAQRSTGSRGLSASRGSRSIWPSTHNGHGQKHTSGLTSRSKNHQVAAGTKEPDNVKAKLQAMWNKVKYGWMVKTRASFGGDSPVVLLGNIYIKPHPVHASSDDGDSRDTVGRRGSGRRVDEQAAPEQVAGADLRAFYLDFESRIWLTYRRDFPRLADSTLTTDCGWGCMLRCGQMALAQGLVVHFLGRDWRKQRRKRGGSSRTRANDAATSSTYELQQTVRERNGDLDLASERQPEFRYRFIVSCFLDSPAAHCPFSLHRLVQFGSAFGKKAGDWYGPGSTAHILQEAVYHSSSMHPVFNDVCVYVAHDCTIYKQDVIDLCRQQRRPSVSQQHAQPSIYVSQSSGVAGGRSSTDSRCRKLAPSSDLESGGWKSVIIFVPMRLGGERLNELYVQCLRGLLSLEHCIGVMGGRPRHSLYFIGFQDDHLIYLDPHLCQDSVDPRLAAGHFDTSSFHCHIPRKLAFADMDPSCTIGFYCRDEADFNYFLDSIGPYLILPGQKSRYPLFIVDEGSQATACLTKMAAAPAKP